MAAFQHPTAAPVSTNHGAPAKGPRRSKIKAGNDNRVETTNAVTERAVMQSVTELNAEDRRLLTRDEIIVRERQIEARREESLRRVMDSICTGC